MKAINVPISKEKYTSYSTNAMKDLTLSFARHPEIRRLALSIVRTKKIRPRDYLNEARAIRDWIKSNIRYTRDPYKTETLQDPLVTLQLEAGDCDDQSVLFGALASSLGHRVRFRIVGKERPSHVFPEVFIQGQWHNMDTTAEIEPGDLGYSDFFLETYQ